MPITALQLTIFFRYVAIIFAILGTVFFWLDKFRAWNSYAWFGAIFHASLFYAATFIYPTGLLSGIPVLRFIASPEGAPAWGAIVGCHNCFTWFLVRFLRWYSYNEAMKLL